MVGGATISALVCQWNARLWRDMFPLPPAIDIPIDGAQVGLRLALVVESEH